jgi:hypothetical protein
VVQIATVPAAVSEPLAEPTVIDYGRFLHGGLAWAPSGKELLFCTGTPSSQPAGSLYRLTLDKPTRRIRVLSDNCLTVGISRPGPDGTADLMYGTLQVRSEMFRLALNGKSEPKPLASSTRYDTRPVYSPRREASRIFFFQIGISIVLDRRRRWQQPLPDRPERAVGCSLIWRHAPLAGWQGMGVHGGPGRQRDEGFHIISGERTG